MLYLLASQLTAALSDRLTLQFLLVRVYRAPHSHIAVQCWECSSEGNSGTFTGSNPSNFRAFVTGPSQQEPESVIVLRILLLHTQQQVEHRSNVWHHNIHRFKPFEAPHFLKAIKNGRLIPIFHTDIRSRSISKFICYGQSGFCQFYWRKKHLRGTSNLGNVFLFGWKFLIF